MQHFDLTIAKIIDETAHTKTIHFNIPSNLKGNFSFIPGQYITLIETIDGIEHRRSYSICSTPTDELLAIGVKKIRGGVVSTYVHDTYSVGQVKRIVIPSGKFALDANDGENQEYFFFAAGSGITPIKSMIENVLKVDSSSRCYLLYGSRNENSIIFKNKFEELKEEYPEKISVEHCLSNPLRDTKGLFSWLTGGKITWEGLVGRIDENKVKTFIKEHKSGSNCKYFICGPGSMISTVESTLNGLKVDQKDILREHFVAPETEGIKGIDGFENATIKVQLHGEAFEYKSNGKKFILDDLMDMDKNPPYSCSSGACSSCIAKVEKGKAEMDVCFALDEEDIAQGYILTCQAKAVSEELSIVFEE